MNMSVAANDRAERLARPHTPWPLVQPLPIWVPTPTASPADASTRGFDVIANPWASAVAAVTSHAPSGRPARNAIRQPRSPLLGKKLRPRIPLTPAIFPFASRSAAAASPISAPPTSPATGVNVVSIPWIVTEARRFSVSGIVASSGLVEWPRRAVGSHAPGGVSTVLFLHETHRVIGSREDEFEAALRDAWMPQLAKTSGARLLHALRHAHGTGPSYRLVTVTALRDGAAWEALVRSVERGELRACAERLDAGRHDVEAKLLIPLGWSPLQEVDLERVPVRPNDAEAASLFMEDTVWPHPGSLEAYVAASGSHYAREMEEHAAEGTAILRVEAAFRTAFGSGRRREVVLWQRVVNAKALVPLLTREVPARYRAPGTWMHDALQLRDQWESRLLRTLPWSPLG